MPKRAPSSAPSLFNRLARPSRAAIFALLTAAPMALGAGCDRSSSPAAAPSSTIAAAPASGAPSAPPAASGSADTEVVLTPFPPPFPKGEHAYADMANTVGTVTSVPVRGRIVKEEEAVNNRTSTPSKEMSQDEIPNAEFEAVLLNARATEIESLGTGKCDSEGYIDVVFPIKATIAPGRYYVDIKVKGAFAGRMSAALLAADHAGMVVRSDVDLTYLDTHFTRKRDMLGLLSQNAAERKTLPAMEKVYGALRKGALGQEDRALVFISGSPRFFKRVLEGRMSVDGVRQDGVFLKPMDEIAGVKLAGLAIDRVVPALKEQVGYKLGHLLRGRLDLPKTAGEILMGDDSEADFVVYSIYHRIMSGELNKEALGKELARAGVEPELRGDLVAQSFKVKDTLGGSSPVKLIYINLTGSPNARLKVSDWPVPGLLRAHRGAWPLILDLHEEGLVSSESVAHVKARLVELGQAQKDLDDAAKAGVTSGFLKPESLSIPK